MPLTSLVKLSCRHLWKVFGPDPRGFLATHDGAPTLADFVENGTHIRACADITFDVAAGEILVVMGLSGSGKSTLIRCLSRLIEPTSGEVWLDGQDLLQATEAELIHLARHQMGMVFQHFGLLPHRTVLENVAFPLEVQGMAEEARRARALEMIKTVGLEGRETYYPRELSGGQQQRVGIARSLAVEPEIWFLDEPFSALDPLIRREMQDEFLRLQRLLHKTIVFITHDFDEAVRLADRIAIMKDGVVVQLGTAEELVLNPTDDYVAQFTKEAPRGKLISARSIMTPVNGQAAFMPGVDASDKLDDIAPEILIRDVSTPVLDDNQQVIGMIGREQLVASLFERRR